MATEIGKKPKFTLGRICATRGAYDLLPPEDVMAALGRHLLGDWGEVGPEDWKQNDEALEDGSRLLSSYDDRNGVRFWIITECDRSLTTVLLPKEY